MNDRGATASAGPPLAAPTRATQLAVRLPPDTLDRVDRLARTRGLSRSQAIRVLLGRGLDVEEGPAATAARASREALHDALAAGVDFA